MSWKARECPIPALPHKENGLRIRCGAYNFFIATSNDRRPFYLSPPFPSFSSQSMSFGGKLDEPRPYHSIDLEASPLPLHKGSSNEERMPLSPRASVTPHLHIQDPSDESKGAYPPRPTYTSNNSQASTTRNGHKSSSSWDVLGGIQKDWNGFDSRNGSQAAFQYAQGTWIRSQLMFRLDSENPAKRHFIFRGRTRNHGN